MWRYLSDGLDLFSKKGMCAQIVFGVERGGKFFGFDGFAAAGGVDEFAVADVEADMGIFVCGDRGCDQFGSFGGVHGVAAGCRRRADGSVVPAMGVGYSSGVWFWSADSAGAEP